MENSVKKAQELYEETKYLDAINMCLELIKAKQDEKDAYAIAAKSFVFTIGSPTNEDKVKTVLNVFNNACARVQSIEELLELERDMTEAIYFWRKIKVTTHIIELEKHPTFESWKEFVNLMPEYTKLIIYVSMNSANSNMANAFCEENGIEKKEYRKLLKEKFGDKYNANEVLTDREMKDLLFAVAQSIFEKSKCKFEANRDGNKDFVLEVIKVVLPELTTARLISSYVIPKKDDDVELSCERLKLKAEIMDYILKAKAYPNGSMVSLYMGNDREKQVEELKELYNRIINLDSDFVAPELPEVTAVTPPAQNSGCYIATAVYGSYDCPQVWTLRRFRDETLGATWYGRMFIRTYYAVSPTLVKWFGSTKWFKNLWKPALNKMVKSLNEKGVENTAYDDKEW